MMMSKKMYTSFLSFIGIVSLLTIQCAINDVAGGSGAETGNAKIVGVIVDSGGKPITNIEVFVYPSSYNPVLDTPPGYPFIDTTDNDGAYSLNVPDRSSYSILAKQSLTDKRAILNEITVENDSIRSPNITLKKVGTIRVTFSPEVEMKSGFVYITGTPIVGILDNACIDAGFVQIDSVPEGLFPTLYYSTIYGKNISRLAESFFVKSDSTTIIEVCLCSIEGKGYNANSPVPVATQYSSFGGADLMLNAWKGKRVAVLTKELELDPCVMQRILSVLDSAYVFNQSYLGQSPSISSHYQSLLSIAESPSSDGFYKGFIGVTGIEMGSKQFTQLYDYVKTNNSFPQELFFALANNFNFYMSRLTHSSNAMYSTAVRRGFPVFMRFITINNIGIKAAQINGLTLAQYRIEIEALMDLYLADTLYHFDNSFAVSKLPFSDLKPEHLYASMLMRLEKLYGSSFMNLLWDEFNNRPVAKDTQMAIDNLVLACSAAANSNLAQLFLRWKFPVSKSVQTEATTQFP